MSNEAARYERNWDHAIDLFDTELSAMSDEMRAALRDMLNPTDLCEAYCKRKTPRLEAEYQSAMADRLEGDYAAALGNIMPAWPVSQVDGS